MLKQIFILMVATLTIYNASATELICTIAGDSKASTLKITYTEDSPSLLSLKSPGEDEYRPLNLKIEKVIEGLDSESFSAKPQLSSTIDWSLEPNCFKEIGTQWYFIFDYAREVYGVYLTPYFEQKDPTCYTPRFRPQPKALNCSFKEIALD